MIDLTTVEYLLAMWFVGGAEGDWLAAVYRDKGDPNWRLTYRFRYYEGKQSGDPFTDDDRKSWYEARISGDASEESLISKVNGVASLTALRFGGEVDCVEVRGTPALLQGKIADRPWLHVQFEYEGNARPKQTTNRPASA